MEARIDLRVLASIAIYFDTHEIGPHYSKNLTKSSLIRLIIEGFYELLVKEGEASPIEWSEEALAIMKSLGYGNINASGRGKQNLVNQINLERLKKTGAGPKIDQTKLAEMKGLLSGVDISPNTDKKVGENPKSPRKED